MDPDPKRQIPPDSAHCFVVPVRVFGSSKWLRVLFKISAADPDGTVICPNQDFSKQPDPDYDQDKVFVNFWGVISFYEICSTKLINQKV
jgi:hypothetical protein